MTLRASQMKKQLSMSPTRYRQMAGGSLSILSDAALSAVHGYAQGNARMIDNLMTDALIIGAQTEKQVIDPETILAAVNNQQL